MTDTLAVPELMGVAAGQRDPVRLVLRVTVRERLRVKLTVTDGEAVKEKEAEGVGSAWSGRLYRKDNRRKTTKRIVIREERLGSCV